MLESFCNPSSKAILLVRLRRRKEGAGVGTECDLKGRRVGKSTWFPPQMSKDYPSALALYPSSAAAFLFIFNGYGRREVLGQAGRGWCWRRGEIDFTPSPFSVPWAG